MSEDLRGLTEKILHPSKDPRHGFRGGDRKPAGQGIHETFEAFFPSHK
jgi:hypothetical protein